MLVAEQLERNQPEIYNFLIACFDLDMKVAVVEEEEEFSEDDYEFRKFQELMQERSSAQK